MCTVPVTIRSTTTCLTVLTRFTCTLKSQVFKTKDRQENWTQVCRLIYKTLQRIHTKCWRVYKCGNVCGSALTAPTFNHKWLMQSVSWVSMHRNEPLIEWIIITTRERWRKCIFLAQRTRCSLATQTHIQYIYCNISWYFHLVFDTLAPNIEIFIKTVSETLFHFS